MGTIFLVIILTVTVVFNEIPFILVRGVKVKERTIKGQSTREAEVKGDAVITVHNGFGVMEGRLFHNSKHYYVA